MDNETGEVYINSALFSRIKVMREYIIELLKPSLRSVIVRDHYRQKSLFHDETELSKSEIDELVEHKLATININEIINGVDYNFENDENETISVTKLQTNTKRAVSIL
jgi:hypothetical protein